VNALIYLESSKDTLPKATYVIATAAKEMKAKHGYQSITALVVGGAGTKAAAEAAAALGFDKVLYVEDEALGNYLALPYAEIVVAAAKETDAALVMAAATTEGKDLAPRITEQLDAAQASDITEILDGAKFKRPMYAGNIIATVELNAEKKVVTVRGTAFDRAEPGAENAPVEVLSVSPKSSGQEFVSFDTTGGDRPELTEADVVVSGGRALKSSENFEEYIAPLADVLGAAIGASRAAVDSGYAPNDWQVGQTGKVVAPSLYIAIGISGAIQHLAGMKDSKVIVAINKDAEAPIFEVADYGLVSDLYESVPPLIEALKAAKSG